MAAATEPEPGSVAEPLSDDPTLPPVGEIFGEAWIALTLVFVVVGLFTNQDGLVLLGVLQLTVTLIARLSNRYVLDRVIYERST